MKKIALFALFALLLPAAGEAQRRGAGCCNSFSFAPYLGAYKDAYDLEADNSDLGWMIGFKAGYDVGDRVRLLGNLGYAEANDVATHAALAPIIDNEWVILTGGAEFALVPGTTSINLAAEAGVSWRRTTADDADDVETGFDNGWGSYETLIPALTLRHQFSQRAGLFVTAQDMIMSFLEDDTQHSPALTLGLSFR
jgi:hypothetical protein